MTERRPSSLPARGIQTVTDNLPTGATVPIAAAFVKYFRAEIEVRLLGIPAGSPPPSRRSGAGR